MPFCLYLKNPTIQVSITCGFQSSLLRTPEDNLDRSVSQGHSRAPRHTKQPEQCFKQKEGPGLRGPLSPKSLGSEWSVKLYLTLATRFYF